MKLEGVSVKLTIQTVIILTDGFKSNLNGLTFTWYNKIKCIYFILKLETPNKN